MLSAMTCSVPHPFSNASPNWVVHQEAIQLACAWRAYSAKESGLCSKCLEQIEQVKNGKFRHARHLAELLQSLEFASWTHNAWETDWIDHTTPTDLEEIKWSIADYIDGPNGRDFAIECTEVSLRRETYTKYKSNSAAVTVLVRHLSEEAFHGLPENASASSEKAKRLPL